MLFTIIVDYLGGTYMSQTVADDAHAAVRHWAVRTSDRDLRTWQLSRTAAVGISVEPPMQIDALQNAWCASVPTREGLLLLNIIGTVSHA